MKLVGKSTYLFDNLKGIDILLGQFLSYSNGEKNQVALMKLEYSSISNFHKKEIMAFVIILFMICESKRYYVNNPGIGNMVSNKKTAKYRSRGFLEENP